MLSTEADEEPPTAEAGEPLIEEISSQRHSSKHVKKDKQGNLPPIKGFFGRQKPGDSLYGPEGSAEGVVPDGAGDPLGYLPKGLRERCKVFIDPIMHLHAF